MEIAIGRIILPLVALAGAAVLMGVECSPSRPGCDFAEACEGLTNPARSCINMCVEVYQPGDDPNRCALDPCNDEAYASGAVLCPSNYFCRQFLGRPPAPPPSTVIGFCTPAAATFGEPCGPVTSCGNGTYCVDAAACDRALNWVETFGFEAAGVCLTPVREGERCDSNLSEHGCRACEPGTFCLSNEETGFGEGRDPEERRCVRRCETAGEQDDSLCGCGAGTCEEAPEPIVAESGEPIGKFFCDPCLAPNAGECLGDEDCCPGTGATCEAVSPGPDPGDSVMTCCVTDGGGCAGFETNPCCAGTVCGAGGECQTCGRSGDDAEEFPCCPGYTEVWAREGERTCEPCRDVGYTCGDEWLTLLNAEASESVALPETHRTWSSVRGGAGGDLVATAGQVDEVIADLDIEHRAFVFAESLASGLTPGSLFIQIPQVTPGTPEAWPLPDPAMSSVRVYDIGECSYVVRWNVLSTLLALEVNKALDHVDAASPLRFMSFSIEPGLRAEPRHASSPLGMLNELDTLEVHATYDADSIAGCVNQTVTVSAGVRIASTPGWVPNPAITPPADELAAEVGCQVAAGGGSYECTVISDVSGDEVHLVTQYPVRNPDDETNGTDALVQEVGCHVRGDVYECLEFFRPFPFTATSGVLQLRVYPRPGVLMTHARDWRLELTHLDADLIDLCAGDWFIDGVIYARVLSTLAGFNDTFADLVARTWGDSFIDDFGRSPAELRSCGLDGDGHLDHWPCRESELFDGRRHMCVDRGGGNYLCDGARLEIRRMQVRPEGVELVLAEGTDDDQALLLAGVPGLIEEGTAAAAAFGADPDLCEPGRLLTDQPPAISTLAASVTPPALIIPTGTAICDDDDPACTGICGQYGTTCALADGLQLESMFGYPEIIAGLCVNGTCT